jgi:hypothetical protein
MLRPRTWIPQGAPSTFSGTSARPISFRLFEIHSADQDGEVTYMLLHMTRDERILHQRSCPPFQKVWNKPDTKRSALL